MIGRDEHDRASELAAVSSSACNKRARAGGRRTRSLRRRASRGSAPRGRPAARMARADRSSAPRETRGACARPAAGGGSQRERRVASWHPRSARRTACAADRSPRAGGRRTSRTRDRIRTGDRAETRTRTRRCGSPPAGSPRRPCSPPAPARTRCCCGTRGRAASRPVRIDACDGPSQRRMAQSAVSNRTPRAASASSVGVAAAWYP